MAEYPKNTFLSPPESRFGDMYSTVGPWLESGFSGVGFPFSYFPGMYLLIEVMHNSASIFNFPGIWVMMILLFTSITISVFFIIGFRNFAICASLILILTFSQPSLLIWSTGNLEGYIAILLLYSFVLFAKKKYLFFTLVISFIASAKLFPAIFILALLFKMRFISFLKLAIIFLSFMILVSLSSMAFLKGGFLRSNNSFIDIISFSNESRSLYADLMYYSEASIPYGHSFLNGVHSIFGMAFLNTRENMFSVAILLSLIIFIPSLVIAYKASSHDWVFILILGSWTLSVVPTSTDYRLVYLWPALIMFFKLRFHSIAHSLIIMWVIVILSPKPYFPTAIHPQAYFQVYFSAFSLVLIPIFLAVIEIYSSRKNTSNPLQMR